MRLLGDHVDFGEELVLDVAVILDHVAQRVHELLPGHRLAWISSYESLSQVVTG